MDQMRVLIFPDGKQYEIVDKYSRDEISNLDTRLDDMYTRNMLDSLFNTKQDTLISGITIKTINGQSILGTGNIVFPTIPTEISAFNNDIGFITKNVTDLTNYYTKQNIESIVNTIKRNSYKKVQSLPLIGEEGITYLVGTKEPYEQYIWEDDEFISIGNTTVHLEGYVTGDNLTDNYLVFGSGSSAIKSSGYSITTSLTNNDSDIPTSKVLYSALSTKADSSSVYSKSESDERFVAGTVSDTATPNTIAIRDDGGRVRTLTPVNIHDAVNLEYFRNNAVETRYTNTKPTTSALGGIAAGTTFDNMSISDVLNKLFYPYVAPKINGITLRPNNGGTFEKGTTINLTGSTITITEGSDELTSLAIYDGSHKIAEINENIVGSNALNFSLAITSDKQLRVELTDASEKTVTINSPAFNFVYPYYRGKIAANGGINETVIESMTKVVQAKGTKTYSYDLSNQKAVFAYPKSYGALSAITDATGLPNIDIFERSEINITGLDGTSVEYYVYVMINASTNSLRFTYSY